ncbi:hypothetical protein TUM17576_10100 [Enterobacter hormaechei]|nr:hypothetical protein TUM17576_10100 [Enterobacter hormaechei]
MKTLDLMVSIGNILPGDLFVHAIHGTYDFRGDSVPGECEHQKHLAAALRTGEHRWRCHFYGHLSGPSKVI